MEKVPAKNIIEAIIQKLQIIMRIQDWDIRYKPKTALEMVRDHGEGTYAFCTRDYQHRCAILELCTELDLIQGEIFSDWYYGLVHEMYHTVVAEFMHCVEYVIGAAEEELRHLSGKINIEEEALVNKLTKAFVAIYPLSNFEEVIFSEEIKEASGL